MVVFCFFCDFLPFILRGPIYRHLRNLKDFANVVSAKIVEKSKNYFKVALYKLALLA